MIVTCPACQTQYRIGDASLGARGRSVRCANCGNRWFVEALAAPAAAAGLTPPAYHQPAATARPAAGRPVAAEEHETAHGTPLASPPLAAAPGGEARPARGGLAGWLLVALLAMLLAAAVVGRDQIVAAFPAALPVYQGLGLPVTMRLGLEFRALVPERRADGDQGALIVKGEIHNVSGQERRVPQLRVALLDDGRQEIRSGLFDAPQKVLPPGGSTRFEVSVANPPEAAKNFNISFAETP